MLGVRKRGELDECGKGSVKVRVEEEEKRQ